MSYALAVQAEPVLLDLRALLREIEALRGQWESLPAQVAGLQEKFEALLAEASEGELAQQLRDVVKLLRDEIPTQEGARAAWQRYREQLQVAYDELCASLERESIRVPAHRPNNVARTTMHVTSALVCALLAEHVLSPTGMIVAAAVGAATCWTLEIGRIFSARLNAFLLWLMGAVAHAHERRHVNSATWFASALVVLAALFDRSECVVAMAVLGLADPAAGVIGRRWGRTPLIHGRSLEGSLTFVAVGTLAGLAALAVWHPELALGTALLISVGAAVPAAVTELLSRRVDDNLTIPIAAACGAWAVGALL